MSGKRRPDPKVDEQPTELELVIGGLLSLLRRGIRIRYSTETYPGGRVIQHIEYIDSDLAALSRRAS